LGYQGMVGHRIEQADEHDRTGQTNLVRGAHSQVSCQPLQILGWQQRQQFLNRNHALMESLLPRAGPPLSPTVAWKPCPTDTVRYGSSVCRYGTIKDLIQGRVADDDGYPEGVSDLRRRADSPGRESSIMTDTPLHRAARYGDAAQARALIAAGADVNALDP